MKSPWWDFDTAWLELMNSFETGRLALSTAPPFDSPSIDRSVSLCYTTKVTHMPHWRSGSAGGGPLGQRCHHNTKMAAHPMHNKQDEPAEPRPPKEVVGQARSYDDIRSRIGKGATRLPK